MQYWRKGNYSINDVNAIGFHVKKKHYYTIYKNKLRYRTDVKQNFKAIRRDYGV